MCLKIQYFIIRHEINYKLYAFLLYNNIKLFVIVKHSLYIDRKNSSNLVSIFLSNLVESHDFLLVIY